MRLAITVAWLLSMLFGIWAVESLPDPAQTRVVVLAATREAAPAQTVVVQAVLQLPTATATARPKPTTAASTLTPTINDCTRTPEPGHLCQVPYPPPPTPTPYPDCALMASLKPGAFCEWR